MQITRTLQRTLSEVSMRCAAPRSSRPRSALLAVPVRSGLPGRRRFLHLLLRQKKITLPSVARRGRNSHGFTGTRERPPFSWHLGGGAAQHPLLHCPYVPCFNPDKPQTLRWGRRSWRYLGVARRCLPGRYGGPINHTSRLLLVNAVLIVHLHMPADTTPPGLTRYV